jgi:hypothetical protein
VNSVGVEGRGFVAIRTSIVRSAPILRHIPRPVSMRLASRPPTRIREPGPSDEDSSRLELSYRETARRRGPARRARIVKGLPAQVDHWTEVQFAGPAERNCSPRGRVAEAEEGVRERDELRVRARRYSRIGSATAAARHRN